MQRYPHQLSGGMQQRVAIAMALANDPTMLILDEPTTGLDATVEAEVLDLIAQLRQELSASILFISHNLAVVSNMCDRVGVLYAGMLVEEGPTAMSCSTIRAIPIRWRCCAACRAAASARIRAASTPFRASCPASGAVHQGLRLRRPLRAGRRPLPHRIAAALSISAAGLSRCHYHDKAQALPRATPSDVAAPLPNRRRAGAGAARRRA